MRGCDASFAKKERGSLCPEGHPVETGGGAQRGGLRWAQPLTPSRNRGEILGHADGISFISPNRKKITPPPQPLLIPKTPHLKLERCARFRVSGGTQTAWPDPLLASPTPKMWVDPPLVFSLPWPRTRNSDALRQVESPPFGEPGAKSREGPGALGSQIFLPNKGERHPPSRKAAFFPPPRPGRAGRQCTMRRSALCVAGRAGRCGDAAHNTWKRGRQPHITEGAGLGPVSQNTDTSPLHMKRLYISPSRRRNKQLLKIGALGPDVFPPPRSSCGTSTSRAGSQDPWQAP